MESKAATPREQIISLLHRIGRDYEKKVRNCNLELEWEVDETNLGAEARIFFWRCDGAGKRTNDLVDVLEFPFEQEYSGNELPIGEMSDWLRGAIDDIVARCGPHEPRPGSE